MSVKIQSIFLKQAFWLLFFNKNENIFGKINEDRCKVLRSSEKLIKIGLRRKIEGNVKVPMGSETREADIVVYAADAKSQPYMFYVGKRRLSVAIDRGRSLAETVANLAERACDFDVRHLNIRDVLVADFDRFSHGFAVALFVRFVHFPHGISHNDDHSGGEPEGGENVNDFSGFHWFYVFLVGGDTRIETA